jgi:4'-phosphopantetheinyl transferase
LFEGFGVVADNLAGIEIGAAPSGSPDVFVGNKPAGVTISISHRCGRAICAIAAAGGRVGCDLELIEPHSQAFIEDYLTSEEQVRVAQTPVEDRDRLVALLWSGKESTLKALRLGLRVDTRCITIQPAQAQRVMGWTPLTAHSTAADIFHGWWSQSENWLQTLVADPAPRTPVEMRVLRPNQQTDMNSRKTATGT